MHGLGRGGHTVDVLQEEDLAPLWSSSFYGRAELKSGLVSGIQAQAVSVEDLTEV